MSTTCPNPDAVEPSPERMRRISRLDQSFEAITASAYPGSVGTSTNCSAVCGTGSTRRGGGHRRLEILGTSITRMTSSGTISAVRCKIWSSIPPIEDCGTGTSIICTGTKDSMIGSTVRRGNRAPAADPHRAPHQKTSKNSVPLPLAVFWPRGALCISCSTNSSFKRDRTARGVVELFSHGHSDAHPLLPKQRTEASLPPPPRGACGDAFSTRARV